MKIYSDFHKFASTIIYGVDECMRVSEGTPNGRIAELYNPEMFQNMKKSLYLRGMNSIGFTLLCSDK